MKKYILFLLFLSLLGFAFVQPDMPEKVKLKYMGIAFEIPKGWRYDSYSSSSVCDCEGVIVDNLDHELRINVYTTDKAGMAAWKRDSIWNYAWDPETAKEFIHQSPERKWQGQIGQWKDEADGHTVIRLNAQARNQFARIFIFGPTADMEAHAAVYKGFLDSFAFIKRKE